MKLKAFFVDALSSALDLGVGTPEDILKYVTPDVLSLHLPRPLWARLLTACLGAPKVDATLVVETIGIPNLCEHIPAPLIWATIAEIAHRSLGKQAEEIVPLVRAKPPTAPPPGRVPLAPPPPEATPQPVRASPSQPTPTGPAIPSPLSDLISELEQDERPPVSAAAAARARTPTGQRFRTSNTGINRPVGSATVRRPQVQASTPAPVTSRPRRGGTEVSEQVTETAVEEYRDVPVDDSQLVDWQSDPGTALDDDFGDLGRKR